MLIKLLTKVFGSRNDRTLRRMRKVVNIINAMEPEMEKLSDEELKGKTAEFRARLEKGEVLENLIPEAFAVVREASKRVFGMRHFDVQLLGGMVLNERCIAEMRTGEGKTLTATLPAYLNALTGKGVHVVTVNDYLAQRDAENNRPLFEFLGLTVGINLPGMPAPAKREAYAADITFSCGYCVYGPTTHHPAGNRPSGSVDNPLPFPENLPVVHRSTSLRQRYYSLPFLPVWVRQALFVRVRVSTRPARAIRQ